VLLAEIQPVNEFTDRTPLSSIGFINHFLVFLRPDCIADFVGL
jgi:hypothetical protein